MVQFAPYKTTPDIKQYGKPDPIDVGRATSSTATAISGAANVLDAGIKATDQIIKESADRQLFEEINLKRQQNTAANASLLNPQEVQPATVQDNTVPIGTTQDTTLPPAVKEADRRMGIIAQANKMGQYDNIQYYGEMQEITQRISSQYPGGYARYIQDRAAHWLGTNAANAQRTAIQTSLAQIAATQRGDAEKWSNEMERDRVLFRKADGSFDAEGYNYALNATDPNVRNNIRVQLGRQKFNEHQLDLTKKQFDLELAAGNVSSERAVRHYGNVAATVTANYTANAQFNFMGKQMRIADINEFVARVRKQGGQIDPTVLAQLGTVAGQFKEGLEKALEAEELKPYAGNRTLQGLVKSKDELTKIRKHFVENVFGSIERNIGAGNLTLATSMLNTTQGRQELAGFRLLENEVIGRWAGLEKTVGGQAAAAIVNFELSKMSATGLNELSETTKRIRMQQIAAGTNFGSLRTALEHFNMLNPAPGGVLTPEEQRERANYLRHEIETVKNFILQKDAPAKDINLAVRAARVIAHPDSTDFITKFDRNQQMQIFANISSPDVAKKIKELSNNEPQLWKDYVAWNYYTFQQLHNTQIASLRQGVADTAGTNFEWTENGQIQFKNPRSLQQQAREGVLSPSATSIQAINNINTGLTTLKTVAELNGDKLTPEFLKKFGITLELPPTPTQGTPSQRKRTSDAPRGSGGPSTRADAGQSPAEGLPRVSFSFIGSANAAETSAQGNRANDDSLSIPNRFDETFDQSLNLGVNEPLQAEAEKRYRLRNQRTENLPQVPSPPIQPSPWPPHPLA